MQATLKKNFRKVANVKPPASRADSSEKFVVAMGFRGRQVEGGAGQGDPEAGPLG
jgi:23S rRNA (uridine2552-2'-O)-methyltransferase